MLHIGHGRTGTTYFQNSVMPILNALPGVSAPYKETLQVLRDVEYYLYSGGALDKPTVPWPDKEGSVALLSFEGLIGADPALWARHAILLSRVFDQDVEIVISLREPISWAMSEYSLAVAMGIDYGFQQYFRIEGVPAPTTGLRVPRGFDLALFDYAALVDLYRRLFAVVHVVTDRTLRDPETFIRTVELPVSESCMSVSRWAQELDTAAVNAAWKPGLLSLTSTQRTLLSRFGLPQPSYVSAVEEELLRRMERLSLNGEDGWAGRASGRATVDWWIDAQGWRTRLGKRRLGERVWNGWREAMNYCSRFENRFTIGSREEWSRKRAYIRPWAAQSEAFFLTLER